MEIHHRRARPSNGGPSADASGNGTSTSPPKRTYGPVKARAVAHNPYAAVANTTDVVLFRSIQCLLLLAATWFLYTMAVVNTPELDTTPLADDYGGGGGSGLRSFQQNVDRQEIERARNQIILKREEFYRRYGGEAYAKPMLERGVRKFEKRGSEGKKEGVRATANRILSAMAGASSDTPAEFVMAFGGYSVTVGRGNRLEQSYPFVLKEVLAPILELPAFGIKLTVRNSAIGGIPSFPYGWCLPNFLGGDADLVSWDYGMNEGNGAQGLEGYVRQALMMPKSPPLFVILDTKRPRMDLLQKYVDVGALPDPIALQGKDAVDKKQLEKWLAAPDETTPTGFKDWDQWGAPKGAPGQGPWHPKKKEHELIGWMLAAHMFEALEEALQIMGDAGWKERIQAEQRRKLQTTEVVLPKPVTDAKNTGVESIIHGSPEADASKWLMNKVSCRTSFLPNISGNFDTIVQSGVAKDEEDMLKARDDSLFAKGWAMDVGKLERETKEKVQRYGGLGYIDMKTALYGIPSSGALKLWLPHEGTGKGWIGPDDDDRASTYFGTVILCEVNEKRGDKECRMTSDLSFKVGDVDISNEAVYQVKGIASYLKKDICIGLSIPEEATVSSKDAGFGLDIEVTVTSPGVTREDGACSISHVIWENQ
ncbi:hypothetical protein ACHAXT_004699 [Thalassiosira profunda]